MKIKYQNMAIFFFFFPLTSAELATAKSLLLAEFRQEKKKGSYGSKCNSLAANFFLDKVRDLAKRNF
jgi:hypothetical protein